MPEHPPANPHDHGTPANWETVAEKIVAQHRIFGNDGFLLQMAIGIMPHHKIMKAIELYGTKVAPIVQVAGGQSGTPRGSPIHRNGVPTSLSI